MGKLNDTTRYFLYRQRLEKTKQKTWALQVLARLLFFLAVLVIRYL